MEKDKELEKARAQYERILKESEMQKKKFEETNDKFKNRQRLVVEKLETEKKDKDKEKEKEKDKGSDDFTHVFT